MKKIQDAELAGKKVLLRVDFNVSIKDGKAGEKFKIAACLETVEYILGQPGVKLALITHFGRPTFAEVSSFTKTRECAESGHSCKAVINEFSLEKLVPDVEEILGRKIKFAPACVGEKIKEGLDALEENEILLLENVRLYPGEEINEEKFAAQLAENFDVFANDAFSVCHRDHASVTGVAKILPSFAGLQLQRELESLDAVKEKPTHPATAIIGGAKIETKLPLIHMFRKKYENVLVGGRVSVEAIRQEIKFPAKVVLPVDFTEGKKDIGPKTIENFKKIIAKSKTIVWNGPMGKFEEKPFDNGTNEILKAVIASGAYVLMGGGESVQILEEADALGKISFVSTGGGAMLEYLSGEEVPGIQVLMG
jgi:3-phosphoglycerate kinase